MRLISALPVFSTLLTLTTALFPAKLIYEFPKGTWLENLVVRPCGSILITTLTGPDLYQINPLLPNPTASLIHHFPTGLATLGITETFPDEFYLILSNVTLPKVIVTPGTQRIYRIKFPFPTAQPEISLAASLPDAILLNGLTTLNPFTLLAADSRKGVVWAINTLTGTSKIVISDPLMLPTAAPGPMLGINGLKVRNGKILYFTNGAQNIFAKIAINSDGTPSAGPATVISNAPTGASYDDFALDFLGDAFLATAGGDSIAEVKANARQRIVAGMMGEIEIAEPTSAQFGRMGVDAGVLYITTAGGLAIPVNGTEVVGGQLVAVDVRG